MRIDRFPAVAVSPGRDGHRPEAVVVHTTVGSFESAVDWFGRPESGVSTHYLVGLDGRIGVFAEEEDIARHAGPLHHATAPFLRPGVDPNQITVGIEFADDGDPHGVARPDAQYEAGAELLWATCLRWRIPLDRNHVVGHREFNGDTTCPGNLDIDRLLRMARTLDTEP